MGLVGLGRAWLGWTPTAGMSPTRGHARVGHLPRSEADYRRRPVRVPNRLAAAVLWRAPDRAAATAARCPVPRPSGAGSVPVAASRVRPRPERRSAPGLSARAAVRGLAPPPARPEPGWFCRCPRDRRSPPRSTAQTGRAARHPRGTLAPPAAADRRHQPQSSPADRVLAASRGGRPAGAS